MGEAWRVGIVGAGAAGLMAADRLSALCPDCSITLYEAMTSPARKVLMAGKSGLNLTHSENFDAFCGRYGAAAADLRPMLKEFGPRDLMDWAEGLGQSLYVGSSGRVFPTCHKASPLIRALLTRLAARNVRLETGHRWIGWDDDGALTFTTREGMHTVAPDATLLALGGPSWPRLGTDGAFVDALRAADIPLRPYRPANCGFDVAWPPNFQEDFTERWAGEPVKSVRLSFDGREVMGDFVLTRHGVEGSAIYALSAPLRDGIEAGDGPARLMLDLRPHQSVDVLAQRLARPRGKQSMTNHLRRTINLTGVQTALLKTFSPREAMGDPEQIAAYIKALPLPLRAPRPINEAISTAGGVMLDALDEDLMVRARPGLFMAGEMLDWEAPTGGYLLTGCFSQGWRAAKGMADYLSTRT